MELGHWLMIIGALSFGGGFIYMFISEAYSPRLGVVAIIIIGTLILPLGITIQDSANMKVKQKQCLQSGGEWLGKREYSVATKTYVTRYNCYTIKEVK